VHFLYFFIAELLLVTIPRVSERDGKQGRWGPPTGPDNQSETKKNTINYLHSPYQTCTHEFKKKCVKSINQTGYGFMDLFEDTCGARVLCYDVSFLNQTLALKT
jgi:hypothetical protein